MAQSKAWIFFLEEVWDDMDVDKCDGSLVSDDGADCDSIVDT